MKRSKPFQFKEFTVEQTLAAFKVTGDSVFLGAWADIEGARHIIDVGTGTALLALMAAQRNKKAHITAIEPDEASYSDAVNNIKNSAWANRIEVLPCRWEDFEPKEKADHIISNPPYFIKQKESADSRKSSARHAELHFMPLLFDKSYAISTHNAKLSIILPEKTYKELKGYGNWFLHRMTRLNTGGKNVRFLLALEFQKSVPEALKSEHLTIRNHTGYTKEYLEQTKDFYLFSEAH